MRIILIVTILSCFASLSTMADDAPATRLADRNFPFPQTKSKKGLQVQMIDDAIALGVKHAAINVMLPACVAWTPDKDSIPYNTGGQAFQFSPSYMAELDRLIKPLSDTGAVVYLILLNPCGKGDTPADRIMRHPNYNDDCPFHLGAFNTVTPDGIKYFNAIMEFLVDRYTRPDQKFGRALGYIMGNEVNSHWYWTNRGLTTLPDYTDDYLKTMRIACAAATKICPAARVYMSLEHHWNIRYDPDEKKTFPAHAFIELFAKKAREQGDFPWHLAFHPYPENLFEPATWNDTTAIDNFDTPRITFKNIAQLPAYFRRPELLYQGKPRHIILSEQGFHTKDGPTGEILQAAAYCYAYYKVDHLDGIDAFILHRHVDAEGEGGLNLGLWSRKAGSPGDPGRKKIIYNVFKQADTPGWEKAFAFAKPVIGIKDWPELMIPSKKTTQPIIPRKP